jgi:hypothetical protein
LFTGPSILPTVAGLTPIEGSGTRMMWFPNKAAIRAGNINGTQWNEANLGQYSTAFGRNSTASGQYATSLGVGNTVTGNLGATALGSNNLVSGSNATGIGFVLTAQSYGSLVVGRYNTVSGNPTTWVATDPLFVIGNGTSSAPNDALVIKKNGDAIFDANTYVDGNATINNNTVINGTTNLNSDANISGTTSLLGPANVYNTLTIKNNNELIAEKSSGITPSINLVPLGVVKFSATFDRSDLDHCNSSFVNLAGNFISASSGGCSDNTGFTSKMGINLFFDSLQVSPYHEVIAVPSIFFNGDGGATTTWNSQLTATGSEVEKNNMSKPYRFNAYMHSSDWGTFGTYTVKGTVMFYGIR